jgi:hypothetical protein
MKRTAWLLAPLLALLPLTAARGQGPVTTLENLAVALWPDYDRPSVLVMLTGTLAADVPLPANVIVPLPADAQINAVARVDAQNRMFDIARSADAGKLTLTTPDPRFHVEYYLPYRVEAGEHLFSFTWLSDLSVERLEAIVQRPAAAISLITEPMQGEIGQRKDGFTYYRMPAQAVPSGQPYSLRVRYPMTTTRLSAEPRVSPASPPKAASPATPEAPPTATFGWPALVAIVGVGLISALVTWRLARGRSAPEGPRAEAREEPGARRSCRDCGLPVAEADRFCSDCGADLGGG